MLPLYHAAAILEIKKFILWCLHCEQRDKNGLKGTRSNCRTQKLDYVVWLDFCVLFFLSAPHRSSHPNHAVAFAALPQVCSLCSHACLFFHLWAVLGKQRISILIRAFYCPVPDTVLVCLQILSHLTLKAKQIQPFTVNEVLTVLQMKMLRFREVK